MPRQASFRARVYFLKTEDGGRSSPVSSGYRPMFDFGLQKNGQTMYNDCVLFFDGADPIQPGETREARVVPIHPELLRGLVRPNVSFEIAEGSRVVGRGEVLKTLG